MFEQGIALIFYPFNKELVQWFMKDNKIQIDIYRCDKLFVSFLVSFIGNKVKIIRSMELNNTRVFHKTRWIFSPFEQTNDKHASNLIC